MSKLFMLDDKEKKRILSIHESTIKKQYLYEANEKGGAGYVDPATDTPEAKIARDFYTSASGPGTNEANMLISIQNIKSAVQFWKVNELVKNLPSNSSKLDIAGVINDEMGRDNLEDVKKIVDALKTAGITATYKIETTKLSSGGTSTTFKENSFKITSQPVATLTTTNVTDRVKTIGTPKVQQPNVQQPDVKQRRQQVIQQTQKTTKEIQKLLGQEQNGNLDLIDVERMIDLLNQ